jgi:serine phosphatase RsbU (regulator of sigma subunit)/anti-sigma regulatory factor (Ser/Thr protein kinase)
MMTTFQGLWRNLMGRKEVETAAIETAEVRPEHTTQIMQINLDIAPHDPLLAYVQNNSGVMEVERLKLESPALQTLRQAGIQLVVPLVSQSELIGLISLGQRMSDQDYSSDDRKLLADLAAQAAPALRVAQLVRQQQLAFAERQRIEQELKVARLIQQTLLPQTLPDIKGYEVTAYYQPAREVGGDFYDFIYFPDGKIGLIVADVTDKGVPAALVMATTRSILRATAERLVSPGAALARTNDVLCPQIPPKMFVTCFYALLDPATGHVRYANAGHDVPYCHTADGVVELRATGMPLGLLPGMVYDEKEMMLKKDEYVLLYSDGLVEAHNSQREMFGFPRLQALLAGYADGATVRDYLLEQLAAFTGAGWEQEDDVTLVTLQCLAKIEGRGPRGEGRGEDDPSPSPFALHSSSEEWQMLAEFEVASAPDNERQAMQQVAEVVTGLPLSAKQVDRLRTAVAEATMNAMEHGNQYDPDKPVKVSVSRSETAMRVHITDHGGGKPVKDAATPDLEAKLAGDQSPRGWGLFLIKNMVDEMNIHQDDVHHTIELIVKFEEIGD